ncbi:ATP-dependent protease [Aspergillus sclerotiicarbonarius CBS 121057]|uniref:ATP-dependent protease n=1 Tax=Aspergillus sclerotiicarbonarius (strain CBS 121057 / IBT 28362) TaxID=1448318 RepID=A0A319ER99_ASPSB|nr:ATP-dependent protease [Aspergillus sclerotiicarbonarius CBS 121057]
MEDASTASSPPPPQDRDDDLSAASTALNLDDTDGNQLPLPAHSIIRLIQCPHCSLPLRTPLRLPCGNTVCKSCLPPIRQRTGISYPANDERKQGFTCYWGKEDTCSGEHCLGDCGTDVLLSRLVDVFEEVLANRGATPNTVDPGAGFTLTWRSSQESTPRSASIGCGLLNGVYDLIKQGRLDHDASEVEYTPEDRVQQWDGQSFGRLREAVRNELDCQVCYSLILDPLTTCCGHTFCRGCVAMVMDHSDLCPLCRRKLNMSSNVRSEPINNRISDLVEVLFPVQVMSRREGCTEDATIEDEERSIPLFVSSLSFPTMPTFLHIFEPRYRTMIQRVMRSRDKKFGMVMYNRSGRLQQGLGRAQFMQYGTVLLVERFELLPDGRSLVIASGVSRFKVISFEMLDGYHVGKIQRVDDIPISQEERQESLETSTPSDSPSPSVDLASTPPECLSTQQLFQMALDFVEKNRREGATWLHPRVLLAYGEAPTDPALFPWWFASVLPLWEDEKYHLLSTTSVRERLKMVVRWVRKSESREWLARPRPSFTSVL